MLFLHFQILDKHDTHFDDDAVSPPSSPTPGLKIIQGRKRMFSDQESRYVTHHNSFLVSSNQ